MNDPITTRVAQLLAKSQHILVPVHELYQDLVAEGLMSWISLEMFEYLIASDETFEVLEGLEDLEMFSALLRAELDVQGFWSEPLAMLRHHASKPELVKQDVLAHLHEMNTALETAWQTRPAGDLEIEAELIHMLMMGDMLEREIKGALHLYVGSEDADSQNTQNLGDM